MRSFEAARLVLPALLAGALGGCAMDPAQLAYRERLENGFLTAEDMVRFKTPERWQSTLVAAARDARAPLAPDSALLDAAREGQTQAARLLIKAGAPVDGRGGVMPPLAAAALRGETHVVRLLIRSGADLEAVGENGLTALMNAVKLNHLGVAKVLLESGANARVVDRSGDNVLAVAVTENQPEMLALLLAHGVSPELADKDGLTALYWAEHLKRPALARILRGAGADPARMKKRIVSSQPYPMGEF